MSNPLQKLFDEFIGECRFARRRRPETIRGYKAVFDPFIKLMPDVTLAKLTPETITEFYQKLQTRQRFVGSNGSIVKIGVKDSTIGTYQRRLHTFFEWLFIKGHVLSNPIKQMKKIKLNYSDPKSIRKPDMDKIRTAVESRPSSLLHLKRDRAMVAVFLFTGIRLGELLGLKVTDVDFIRQTLRVDGETSKSKRTRFIPLNPHVTLVLDDYLQERNKKRFYTTASLFVSLHEDRGLSKDGLKHWVKRLVKLSGVKFHSHRFRHTFASNLGASGVSAIQIQKLMGHTDLRMTQAYVRSLNVDDFRGVTNVLTFEDLN